jgi:hypothetical protein
MAFRVTYTPIYNARIGQTKSYIGDFLRPAALIYNQSDNLIETKYYGENLKGAIARIGTVEKSLTYNLTRLSHIPAAGQMFDDDYYISAVSVEFLPTMIKCTIGLSKDFNRLSQYIGIDSEQRFYEISESQAVERNTLWKRYIVIGDVEDNFTPYMLNYGLDPIDYLVDIFRSTASKLYSNLRITCVWACGADRNGNENNDVLLPVISSAFGNSISFSWGYEDNYSAGSVSTWEKNDNVKGYWQDSYPYANYYGKIYYYWFSLLLPKFEQPSDEGFEEIAMALPSTSLQRIDFKNDTVLDKWLLRKDNREILQCNFQIDLVSNRKGLIIGSALAALCPLITNSSTHAKLYVLKHPIDKFVDSIMSEGITSLDVDTDYISDSTDIAVKEILDGDDVSTGAFCIDIEDGTFHADGKAWAIITDIAVTTELVEDDNGEVSEQAEYSGGKVLLAQNMDIVAEDIKFEPIYFTPKREMVR